MLMRQHSTTQLLPDELRMFSLSKSFRASCRTATIINKFAFLASKTVAASTCPNMTSASPSFPDAMNITIRPNFSKWPTSSKCTNELLIVAHHGIDESCYRSAVVEKLREGSELLPNDCR